MDYTGLVNALRLAGVEIDDLPDLAALLEGISKLADWWRDDIEDPPGSSRIKLSISFNVWIERNQEN